MASPGEMGSAPPPLPQRFPLSALEVAPALLESIKEAVREGKRWGGNPQVGFDLYTLTGPQGVACRAREAGLNPPRGATLWRRCRQDFAGVWHLYKWSCEAGQKSGWVLDTNQVCEQIAAQEGEGDA